MRAVLFALLLPCATVADTLNVGRFGPAAVVLDDAIYVVGGFARGGLVGSVERIDPTTGKAQLLSASVRPRFFHHAVTHNDRIIIYGGYAPDDEQGRLVESFDPRTGEVVELTRLPRARKWPRGWVIDNRLYIIGGSPARQNPVAEVDIYDFETGTWHVGASKPTPTEAVVFYRDGKLYAVAGYNGRHGTTVFEVYDPSTDTWDSLSPLPVRTSAHSATLSGDQLYVMGDYHQVSRTMVYDFTTDEWAMLKLDYKPSRHHAALWHDDTLWVIGGNVDSQTRLEWIQRFPLNTLVTADTRAVLPSDDLTDMVTQTARAMSPGHHPLSNTIDEWLDALSAIDAIQIRWYRRHEHALMGELGEPALLCEFLYAGPQRYSLFIPEHQLVIESNHEGVQFRSSARNAHYGIAHESDPHQLVSLLQTLNIPLDIAALMVVDPKAYMERRVRLQQWRLEKDIADGDRMITRMRTARQPPFLPTRGQGGWIDLDADTGLWLSIQAVGAPDQDEVDLDDPLSGLLGGTRTVIAATHVMEPPGDSQIRSAARQEGDTTAASATDVYRRPAGTCGVASRTPVADPDALMNNPAPPFTLTLLDGDTFDIEAQHGKVVVIDFWATWCGPCVQALPHMRTLAGSFEDEDVVFLGVSRDRAGQERQVRQVLERHEITFANGIDVDDIAPRYGVRGIPNVVLIDKDGIIRSRKVGFSERTMQQLKAEIQTWLDREPTVTQGEAS